MKRAFNDNGSFHLKTINDNDNELDLSGFVFKTPRDLNAKRVAMDFVRKFQNPGGFKFYLSAAYKYSEAELYGFYDLAQKKTYPVKYFTTLCKNNR